MPFLGQKRKIWTYSEQNPRLTNFLPIALYVMLSQNTTDISSLQGDPSKILKRFAISFHVKAIL